MRDNPKISIITPTYNSEQYLEKCILSLINQQYDNYEHIIIDGGSTDGTIGIIKKYQNKYPLQWMSEPDDGMYDAINKGFHMATGEIFAWINSDDFYYPWTLNVVANVFSKRKIMWLSGIPSVTKVFGSDEITYMTPNLPVVYCTEYIRKGLYDGKRLPFLQQESCFWSRTLWEQCMGINSKYKYAGDYFLWKEFAEHTTLYSIHCNLASFRIHSKQKSENISAYYAEIGEHKIFYPLLMWRKIYIQLYSLINYRKFVINLDSLYK